MDALLTARYVTRRSWQEDLFNLFFCQAQSVSEGGLSAIACCSLDNKDAAAAAAFEPSDLCPRGPPAPFLDVPLSSFATVTRAAPRRPGTRCRRVLRSLLTPPRRRLG